MWKFPQMARGRAGVSTLSGSTCALPNAGRGHTGCRPSALAFQSPSAVQVKAVHGPRGVRPASPQACLFLLLLKENGVRRRSCLLRQYEFQPRYPKLEWCPWDRYGWGGFTEDFSKGPGLGTGHAQDRKATLQSSWFWVLMGELISQFPAKACRRWVALTPLFAQGSSNIPRSDLRPM